MTTKKVLAILEQGKRWLEVSPFGDASVRPDGIEVKRTVVTRLVRSGKLGYSGILGGWTVWKS